jgi:tRNA threonylcarbamoyladenosine biosynthesis protein TsaE
MKKRTNTSAKKEVVIRSRRALQDFAKKFAAGLCGGEVIALSGPLGAGKTTLAQFLGKALGVRERITSPTFTLMHLHPTNRQKIKLLAHLDAYRLGGARDLLAIGALDYLGRPDTVSVIEWGEKVRRALPKKIIWLEIAFGEKNNRLIKLKPGYGK